MFRTSDDAELIKRHVEKTSKAFLRVVRDVKTLFTMVKKDAPDPSDLKDVGTIFVRYLKDEPSVVRFLNTYIGRPSIHQAAGSWRRRSIYAIRDIYLKKISLQEAQASIEKIAHNSLIAMEMHKEQKPLKKVLPDDILPFLPRNIIVEVDKRGVIQRVTDRFENERLTLAVKIEKQKLLVADYNSIVRRVKKDLTSTDEITRLAALVTSIIMETGIRPGKEGNAAVKTVAGEKVEVETFGAITLTADHVRFVRSEFAELEFVGKKGSVNLATVSDREIVRILQSYVDRALTKGSKFVFVADDGTRFTYVDLQRYFREHFDGLSPTDFRKLRATQTVLEKLGEEQVSLYQRIRALVDDEVDNLTQRVVQEVVSTLEVAYEHARQALSHDSVKTTVEAYVNPEVVLRFLSEGRVQASLEAALLNGTPALAFDPQTFIEQSKSKRGASGMTLQSVLKSLEEDLQDRGYRVKMASMVASFA